MKPLFAILALFAVVSVRAQTTTPADDAMQAQVIRRLMERPPDQSRLVPHPEKPNEIRINGISYDGFFIQLLKTDSPLQLFNPAAAPEYGSSEDNVARDSISGRMSGLKLFSIHF